MSDDIVSKADDFINRRRAQAGIATVDESNEEVPVLTDIVNVDEGSTYTQLPADLQREQLARELEAWLDQNLPQAVIHTLDGITDKLIAQIHQNAHTDLLPRLQLALKDKAKPE